MDPINQTLIKEQLWLQKGWHSNGRGLCICLKRRTFRKKTVLARITYSAEITVFVNICLFSETLNCCWLIRYFLTVCNCLYLLIYVLKLVYFFRFFVHRYLCVVQGQVPVTFLCQNVIVHGLWKIYVFIKYPSGWYLPVALEKFCVSGMVSTSMKSSSGLFEAEFEAEISWVSGTILVGFGGVGYRMHINSNCVLFSNKDNWPTSICITGFWHCFVIFPNGKSFEKRVGTGLQMWVRG